MNVCQYCYIAQATALRAGGGTSPSRTRPLPVPPLPKFLDPPLAAFLSSTRILVPRLV